MKKWLAYFSPKAVITLDEKSLECFFIKHFFVENISFLILNNKLGNANCEELFNQKNNNDKMLNTNSIPEDPVKLWYITRDT